MKKEQIEEIIAGILIKDGSDGHCDGADIIAEFVDALLNGKGNDWLEDYFSNN